MSSSAIETTDVPASSEAFQQRSSEHNMLLAAKGGGITFAGKLFTFGCRLIITFLLARMLGAEQYGLYNLGLTALTVASALAAFGLDSALVRYIPVFARRGDDARLWGTLQISIAITFIVSILIGAGLFLMAGTVAKHIFHVPDLAPVLKLSGIIVPILTLNAVAASATQGFKKMQYATISRDIAQPLLRVLLVVVLVVAGANAVGAVAIYGIAVLITTGMLIYYLNRLFPLRRPWRGARRDYREISSYSVPVFFSDLMMTFRDNVQTLLLGAFNTAANVGIFAITSQLNLIGNMFQSAIATAARPIISELYDEGEVTQMGRMYQTTTKWTFTVNLPVFLVMVLFPAQILSIFGKSFVAGSTALVLLACANMADVSTGMCGNILDMTGHTTWKLINAIVRLGLTLALNLLLIPRWGVIGAAVAVLAAVSVVNLMRMTQVFFLFRLLPYDASFAKPLVAGLAGLLSALALGYWLPEHAALLRIALMATVLFAVYVAGILLLGLSMEDRLVLARLRKRLRSMVARSGKRDHQPQT